MQHTIISTIRHAHTEYNAQRRYAGSIDIPLSKQGVRDARAAARKLAETEFDVVVSSPLERALATARIIAAGKMPIVISTLCVERGFGVLEGRTWEDVASIEPRILLIRVGDDFHTVNAKGAEPFEDVWQRARMFRSFLFSQYGGKRLLVVSHGVFLQLFNGLLRKWNCIESLVSYPANLELYRFCFEDDRLTGESVVSLGSQDVVQW